MESAFLNQAVSLGRVFEISAQRGVLEFLIHQGLLDNQHPVLAPWKATRNADICNQLIKALGLTDTHAQDWVKTMVRHILVLGYGLGWTVMRECLKHSQVRQPTLEAIWCPLTLLGEVDFQADDEATARAFQEAFKIPDPLDLNWVRLGQPARADFLLWLSSKHKQSEQEPDDLLLEERKKLWLEGKEKKRKKKCDHSILCLEFSYNAPATLADFRLEEPHRREVSRYARYMDSRGVFSRVCAEVEGEEFEISSNLANHLSVFSSSDKPLFKLCQASSYTDQLIRLLRSRNRLQGVCGTRAIAVTPNGFESLAAQFVGYEPEPDPRARLMQSLGNAYRKLHKLNDDAPRDELDREIRLVFNKLVRSLPSEFKQQAQKIAQPLGINSSFHYLFQETVDEFHNPMQAVSCDEAINSVEETVALHEFFQASPKARIADTLNQQNPQDGELPLRKIHAAAVIAGLQSAQAGRVNVIALEGNPGIGKTTAVTQFLKQQSHGYLFLYVSPRVVINRDVTMKLARNNSELSGIMTVTTNAKLIASAPQWYEQQVQDCGWAVRAIDSAVVVDGIEGISKPICNTVFITPDEEHDIDCNIVASTRFKRSRSEREDSVESSHRPGVLKTLAGSARRLLEENPQVNRLVMTGAIQGYRSMDQKTTVDALNHLFSNKAGTKAGRNERQNFAQRISTIVVMVDELAGDGAGALFAHKLAEWLQQQFIDPFEETQSPFRVVLIISDASLSNEIVLNSYLNAGERAPDKVLLSQSQGESPFRVTGTYVKVGSRRHPTLHVMTNSYPASELKISYSIRLSPVTPGLTQDGRTQSIRQAIREQSEEQLLTNAYLEIQKGLQQNAEQIIFFAQDKAFLRQLREKLTYGASSLLETEQVAVLDQSVPEQQRVNLIQEPRRDQMKVFLMTSSGARGVSFPKTDWIIASIPRFNIEAALMEVAQLIYRGRGMYTDPDSGTQISGDAKSRQLVMLINDFVVKNEDSDQSRLWLRQASDLLTLLVMLRSTILTRIKGDAGLRRQRIAFVPVGFVGDEELLSLMSDDVRDFLREAQVFICDDHSAEQKAKIRKAEQLVRKTFAQFNLVGQAQNTQTLSYANYETLEAFVKSVSRSSSNLIPSLENQALVIPDYLSCIGPVWLENWSDRTTEERFRFEGWRADVQASSGTLLGLLRDIAENQEFPPKLKRSAKELHKLLIREREAAKQEYATLQAMKTRQLVISLPLDYPHFWANQNDSKDSFRQQLLEDPEAWRDALGRSLTPQGVVMPVIAQYQAFPWAAVAGRRMTAQLETIFDDRYFMASSELNLLNTILLEDEE